MLLADDIVEQMGSPYDRLLGEAVTNIGRQIIKAERFVMTDPIADICGELPKSKPSSLLTALNFCRLPYPSVWIEWSKLQSVPSTDPMRPDPTRTGCLVERFWKDDPTSGLMTFAWTHRDPETRESRINVCPVGLTFSWQKPIMETLEELEQRGGTDSLMPFDSTIRAMLQKRYFIDGDEQLSEFLDREAKYKWASVKNSQKERAALLELMHHALPAPTPYTAKMVYLHNKMLGEQGKMFWGMWENDIKGEGPFIEAFLAMLNSKNGFESEKTDLAKLNKARAKRGRAPLLDHSITRIRLTRSANRVADARGIDRSHPGWHPVRGHFKVRKSGVYWWNDFGRGDPARPAVRSSYKA